MEIQFTRNFHPLIRIYLNELDDNMEISAGLIAALQREKLRPREINYIMFDRCGVTLKELKSGAYLSLVIGNKHFLLRLLRLNYPLCPCCVRRCS